MVRWKYLYGNTNFQISDEGVIRSVDRIVTCIRLGKTFTLTRKGQILSSRRNKYDPHKFTTIQYMDEQGVKTMKTVYLLRAVADHFVTKPNKILLAEIEGKTTCASHIIKDYDNNRFDNVVWKTLSDIISEQPNRLLNPTKSWDTRRTLYGKTGTPMKNKN